MRLPTKFWNLPARWQAAILGIFLAVVLIIGGYAAKKILESAATVTTPPTLREKNTLRFLNVQRAKYHLSPLHYDATLAKYAREHTQNMILHNYFSHDEPGGLNYAQRVRPLLQKAGRQFVAENIALGSGPYGYAQALVNAWMKSPGHRANILNSHYDKTGLGIAVARSYLNFPDVVVATDEFSN